MIVTGIILTTWLTLTAAGFTGLSALDRARAREAAEADLTPSELQAPASARARIPIPKALAR
jgi:hypothetical protein